MPDLSIENEYPNEIIAGIDEVGRGCWAGPLVAGAVIINKNMPVSGIDDSKKLSAKRRLESSQSIIKNHITSIGSVSVSEINELGLSKALYLAISRAIELLPQKPTMLLIDGNYNYDFGIKQINIIKGDSKSVSIAAASVIAKVYRDNIMQELSSHYPEYCWDKNVGYGTALHIEGLKKLGVSNHHRINYKPIREILVDKIN